MTYIAAVAAAFAIGGFAAHLLAKIIVWASYDPSHTGQPPSARFVDLSGRLPPERRSPPDLPW